jgi:predicted permease
VKPVVGRAFAPDDGTRERLVLIAHGLWQRRFASDPEVSGRVILMNGEPAIVIGVLPSWFRFPAAGELPEAFGFSQDPVVWSLDVLTPEQRRNRGGKSFALIGRLKPGVSARAAQDDLAVIAADIAREFPATNGGSTVRVISLREQLVGSVRPALLALFAAVGLILLIACANVANLLLVRAAVRQREVCVRVALGAPRSALVTQMMIESLLLSAAAGAAGLVIAWWTLEALLTMMPSTLPGLTQAGLDWRMIAFTGVVSLATGLTFGIFPAAHCTSYDTAFGLREGARGTIGGRASHRTRNTLVVIEVALAAMLLIGSVLLIQTFLRVTRVETGFRSDGILTMEIALPKATYAPPRASAFFETLLDGLSALPGVEDGGVTSGVPLSGRENLALVTIEGRPRAEPGQDIISDYRVVSPGYFRVFGIPLVDGSPLPDRPLADGPRLILINERMAQTWWPGQSPLGRRLKIASYDQDAPWHTVTGVVGDTRYTRLESALRPQVYVHHVQDPTEQMAVVLRSAGDPKALAAPARAAVSAIDRNQPVARVRTMEDVVHTSVAGRRFHMSLVGVFASLAVILSVIGLYAVVSFSVAERSREMGLRLALGARPADLMALVLAEGLKLVGAGIVIGVGAAILLIALLDTQLAGLSARDSATFVVAPAILFTAGVLGCLAPARRAMRVDPATALRSE